MKEFDLRVPGLTSLPSGGAANLARIREVRDTILSMAGGFTEIAPDELTDLLPGKGMGYIVSMKSEAKARALQSALTAITSLWGAEPVSLTVGSKGPRKDACFFLIPEKANPDSTGKRRFLFREERWAEIRLIIQPKLSRGIAFVYGEWLPEGSAIKSTDELRMYVVDWKSAGTETYLRRFLQTRVFDGGIECDQWFLYLSIRGRSHLVAESLQKGF